MDTDIISISALVMIGSMKKATAIHAEKQDIKMRTIPKIAPTSFAFQKTMVIRGATCVYVMVIGLSTATLIVHGANMIDAFSG